MVETEELDIASRLNRPFENWMKGMPVFADRASSSEIGALRTNILAQQVSLPCAVIKESALRQNEQWMAEFARRAGVKLCPHGKTTMSPELFARQLANGAWGITAATPHQVRVMRNCGIRRILYANQPVDPVFIRYVVSELTRDSEFEFYCLADSIRGIEILSACAGGSARPLNVLLEVGQDGARTGVRSLTEAVRLAQAITRSPDLRLTGVETYEFAVSGDTGAAREKNIARLLEEFLAIAVELDRLSLFQCAEVILSAGGSTYFDLAASAITAVCLSHPVVPIIRSGCYLTADALWLPGFIDLMRSRSSVVASIPGTLTSALEVWSYVQSRPEQSRLLLSLGKRDVSHDIHLPRPICWYRPGTHNKPVAMSDHTVIEKLNDQHAFVRVPCESPLMVGDMVAVGIAHPCTTLDKWRSLLMVDDEYNVVGAVATRF